MLFNQEIKMMKTMTAILATIIFGASALISAGNEYAGDSLHEEAIKSRKSDGSIYDFSDNNDGVYTIVSDDDDIKTTTDENVNQSAVQVLSSDVEHKPIFLWKVGSITVNDLSIVSE
jgi:hypothetical protein